MINFCAKILKQGQDVTCKLVSMENTIIYDQDKLKYAWSMLFKKNESENMTGNV